MVCVHHKMEKNERNGNWAKQNQPDFEDDDRTFEVYLICKLIKGS